MNKKIIIKSPAKINLTLEVIRKYKDDFHEIKSVVMNSDLHDEIVLEKSNTFEIITNSNIPQNENLIYKSYVFLKEKFGDLPTNIYLKKNIPLDSGLGGGSSNAANFLKGMNQLWELDLNNDYYGKIGRKIGSDVNLFFHPGINLLKNTGSDTENIDANLKGSLIIFHDDIHIPKKTFKAYNIIKPSSFTDGTISEQLIEFIKDQSINLTEIDCFNVFNEYINILYPDLLEFKHYLTKLIGKNIHMSGSGKSLFCLFEDFEKANYIYKNIEVKNYKKILTNSWKE